MTLRPYQTEAFKTVKTDLDNPGAALVVMPTGSGKSHVIAAVAALVQPVLILQPSRELLIQNLEKLALVVPRGQIGVYSASFKSKEVKKFTFATIQSVYKKAPLFSHIPLVVMDECHKLAPRALGTMYMEFLRGMGNPKVIGFTATPYRLEVGYFRHKNGDLEAATMLKLINRMRHKSQKEMFWKKILYHIPHQTLVEQGFLNPLKYIHEPLVPYAEIPVNQSHSDYNLETYAQAIVGREAQILSTISEAQRTHTSVLVFCATIQQAITLQETVKGSRIVTANTPSKNREKTIEEFKSGAVKTVFNVSCLTAGFDHPALDCIILLRPTRSPLLYNQMLGRGTRLAPGKDKCTIIDLTGTCKEMGRVETFDLYQNDRGLWDLRTEKHDSWHDRVLFSRIIEGK